MADVRVRNDELKTTRQAQRELSGMLDALQRGDVEKVVLTQRNQMRGVIVSIERWAVLQAQLETPAAG